MKKHQIFFTVFITGMVIMFTSACSKKIQRENYDSNVAIRLESSSKSFSSDYNITVYCGHDKSSCNNACITINGVPAHFSCQGYGNQCNVNFSIRTNLVSSNNYTATTLDSTALTNEDFFNMPSRSLFVEYDEKNNEVWLNIPAQLVFRDSVSHQFTFTGLYYSNSQIYANN